MAVYFEHGGQMTLLRGLVWLSMLSGLAGGLRAQEPMPGSLPDSTAAATAAANLSHSPAFKEADLLRRESFSTAERGVVMLRVFNRSGQTVHGLKMADFSPTVNGTKRAALLRGPEEQGAKVPPLVLLVFPPNQPILHSIAVAAAKNYFAGQPEVLPWKVGIFDSDGTATAFTDQRMRLASDLNALSVKVEPIQVTSEIGVPGGLHWEGKWLTHAVEAIGGMQSYEGAKVLLAFNPLAESFYGENDRWTFANDPPEALIGIAQRVGAQIYVGNVGGPEVAAPGGDASQHGIGLGRLPVQSAFGGGFYSPNGASVAQQTAMLTYFAYRSSLVRQTAEQTMGGFSNSMKDLGAMIHRDLDDNYALTFEMTAADRDKGGPAVEVRLADHADRVSILNVMAVGPGTERRVIAKATMDAMWKASARGVASADFRIMQRVDLFPLRDGLQPVLPMSAEVRWVGKGAAPVKLSVAEYVENTTLSTTVLEREVEARWVGRGLGWERDGHLYPGRYTWRVVVHDDAGTVIATAEQKIKVDFPQGAAVLASTVVLGSQCRQGDAANGMRKRAETVGEAVDQVRFAVDPMRAGTCRVKPEPAEEFSWGDLLHAFLRIYPAGKLGKQPPDNWTASFVLRSDAGVVVATREMAFGVDSGSGYLASVEMPLGVAAVRDGRYALEVRVKGPGIKKELVEMRRIVVTGTRVVGGAGL